MSIPPPPLELVNQIGQCLSALTQPDTVAIRQAEAALKPLLKTPESMSALWSIITTNQQQTDPALRHVAAIVLRKRLPAHFCKFSTEQQNVWLPAVLQAVASEAVRPVRTGLTAVAAALAHIQPQHPALLEFVAAAANNQAAEARELCFGLLQEMTETVGLHWMERDKDLYQLFAVSLNSQSSNPQEASVQKAAVKAAGQLLSFWSDQPCVDTLAPLLPAILQVSKQHLDDDDFLAVVLDVLYDLCYSPAAALQPHLHVTMEFALAVLHNKRLELRVRDTAALVIATTAEAKPKSFGRDAGLLGAVLDTLFQLMQDSTERAAGALFESNPAWRKDLEDQFDTDPDADPDAPTETSMAQGTLDMLACEIPKKFFWPAALQRCLDRLNPQQPPHARKAGVAGLGVIAEGCADPLTAALPQVLPYVFNAAQDTEPVVRECACFCLGQVSEHCQPDILQYASQILPIVFQLLDDPSAAVQATSCYVLETFCERLEPDAVRPLLDSLVRKLAGMLEVTTKRSVQEMAVAALAATAVAAEDEFAPYLAGVATLTTPFLQITDPERFSLRGRALECMGHMSIAVGKEHFRPYFAATMQCAMEGLTLDSTDLQEFAYAVFANLAKVHTDEFAPALPDLVPFLLQVIAQEEGQIEAAEQDKNEAFQGLDDSDDEDDDEDGQYVLHVRTALLDVKKGAITALGEMAAHTGTAFCPHLEACMQVLQKAATNWHPLVKSEVAEVMPSLIIPSVAAYHNGTVEWVKGDISSNPLSQHTQALVSAVLQEELALLQDEAKVVVAKACDSIQSVIELCGPSALIPIRDTLLHSIHAILQKTSPCQADETRFGEVPDDDDEHDTVLQAACDVFGGMGRVLGGHMGPFLPQFFPLILEYGKTSRPPNDRSMSIGCLSEIAQEMPAEVLTHHWKNIFLPSCMQALVDEEDSVKRNAAFCVGLCCETLVESIASEYPQILPLLGNMFSSDGVTDSAMACVDNAAAAVARMIMACPNSVPMEQVLPVFLQALPLKSDFSENDTVYTCLLGLWNMQKVPKDEVQRILTAVMSADEKAASRKMKDELQARVQATLQGLQ